MKKILLLLCLILSISLLTGCISIKITNPNENPEQNSNLDTEHNEDDFIFEENENLDDDFTFNEDSNDDELDNNFDEDSSKDEEVNKPATNSSSFADGARQGNYDNPIKSNEVGIIPVYNYESESKEANIYLRIKETFSGQRAKEMADEYNETALLKYTITDKCEWFVAKIEVDFKDYQTSEYGTTAKLSLPTFSVTEADGGGLTFNDYSFFMMPSIIFRAVDSSIEKIYQGDVVEFYIIYALPKGYDKDYVIAFTQADYKTRTCFLIEN